MVEKEDGTCCGEVNPMDLSDEEFAAFCKTPEFIAAAPSGKLDILGFGTVYVDGAGQWLTKEAYAQLHNGADAEVLWQAVKRYRAMVGTEKAVYHIGSRPFRSGLQPVKLGMIGRA